MLKFFVTLVGAFVLKQFFEAKMQLSIVLQFCLVIGAQCAPQPHSNGSSSISVVDEISNQKISNIYEFAQQSIQRQQEPARSLSSVLLRSIDKACVLNHYKNHGLVDKIPDFKNSKFSEIDLLILSGFAKACSSKIENMLSFVFEAFMSAHFLLEIYLHEPEFKEFNEMLMCANNYAFNNKYLDSEVYMINHTLPAENETSCRLMIEGVEKEISHTQVTYQRYLPAECVKEIFDDAKKILLKYALLIQIDLTAEQKKELRSKFIADVRKNDEKMIICTGNVLNQKHE